MKSLTRKFLVHAIPCCMLFILLAATNLSLGQNQLIKVVDVYRLGNDRMDRGSEKRSLAGIGDIIQLKVVNLKALVDRSACTNTDSMQVSCTPQPIRLFIEGRMIKGLEPEIKDIRSDTGIVQFHLLRTAEDDEAWADLLGAPEGKKFWKRTSAVSIGLQNGNAEYSTVSMQLQTVRKNWFYACVIGLVLYLVALFILARRSNVLRDGGIDTASVGIIRPATLDAPYSLGRFQMAFWFSVVIACFLFIWLVTGNYDIITPAILALIGISAGTSITAAVIDQSKTEDVMKSLKEKQMELDTNAAVIIDLQQQVNAPAVPANAAELKADLFTRQANQSQLQLQVQKLRAMLQPKGSRGFILDILSDANGVSFHRLQMFVWTLVLGVLFVYTVWARLAMPEFSATLLALQGLTAGTYLGFKIPEKNA